MQARAMEIRVLGPVEVVVAGRPVALRGPKQRAVLALLALNANLTVPVDRLIEGLWGEQAPATADKMVQLYVSQLRKLLSGGAEILTRGRGYELRLDPEAVDALRFERLLEAAGRDGEAGETVRAALRLWRGPPLSDLVDEPFAPAEMRRLEHLRLAAVELEIESDLEVGRHREVIGRLEALVAEEPLRERLHWLRMLALYRAGRQADALQAFREARAVLVEEIGVEPGPELRKLQEAILRQAPALDLVVRELPPELLHGSPRLAGRAAELDRLRAAWRGAREGPGAVVLLSGAPGIGKTRLIAELARERHAERTSVVYVGAGAADALQQVDRITGPALLVFDDLDRAPAEAVVRAAELAAAPRGRSLVVLAYRDPPPVAVRRLVERLEGERLELGPLETEAVREIAELYAGQRAVSAPVEQLRAASGGLPARVHEVVADWTTRLAAGRLEAGAAGAAERRRELRRLEAEVSSNVVELHAVREQQELYAAPALGAAGATACPYKGLASYDEQDADLFFGRERLIADIVARLAGVTLLGVIGPSGSGKSSVVRAGLLPALAAGVLPGSERWRRVLLRPGEHPLAGLRAALEDHTEPDRRLVVAVDQFEETFTACRDESERAGFVDALVDAAQGREGRVLVVLALRADYYGACAAHPRLARLLDASQVLVGPMRADELTRAIEGPARRAGLIVEPELVTSLVSEVEGQAGGLPLLSAALLELWPQRQGRRLAIAAYRRTGGVQGAVARLAEQAYEALTPDEQRIARRVMLRLAAAGEGGALVRRRVPLDEIEADRDQQARRVLDVLTASRLVTLREDTVEVAHEALLREWPRLRGWLEEDAQGRRLHRHLTLAARDWDSRGRDPGELYRGARLAAALDWATHHDAELNIAEHAFLDASRSASERAHRRLRAGLAAVASLLMLAVAAGIVALEQRGTARKQATAADAQRVGAQALTEERLDRALLLARAGVELDDSLATRSNLLAALQRSPRGALGVLHGWGGDAEIYAAAVSPDGRLLAIGDAAGAATVFDASSRRQLGRYRLAARPGGGLVQTVTFSPDGRTLAVTGYADDAPGVVVDLVDARTRERRVRAVLPEFPEPAEFVVATPAFLQGGRDLLVMQSHPDVLDGPPSILLRVDGRTGKIGRPPLPVGRHAALGLFPTPDRKRVLITSARDEATYVIDARSLRVVRRLPVGDVAGALSPDGRTFALGSVQGGIRLLDLRTGGVRRFAGRHREGVVKLVFTPDGRGLASSDRDGGVIAWHVARGEIAEQFSAHRATVEGLAVSPDGRTLYSAGNDARTILWDLAGDQRLVRSFVAGRPFEVHDTPRGLAVSPDGRTLASTHSDGAVDLIDAWTLRRGRTLRAMHGFAAGVAFSPDGRRLAVAGEGGRVTLWNARTLAEVGELRGLRADSQAVAFSPDGRLIAAADTDEERPSLRVWDTRGRLVAASRGRHFRPAIAFSPDSRLLAAAAFQSGTEVRDARSAKLVKRLPAQGLARSVAFSPDGRLLAVGQYNGDGRLYSTQSWRPFGRQLKGHTGRITYVDFSPDGRTLATAGADGAVALWDVQTQRQIGSPLTLQRETFAAAAFGPTGSHLFAVSTRGRGVRLDTNPEAWKRHACLVAGRELTRREWQDALPGRPHRTVCRPG